MNMKNDQPAKIAHLQQDLANRGVKYCVGAYVDIHGVPKGKFVPLHLVEPPELSQMAAQANPDDCFNYAWVSSLLERVLEEVESHCHREGKTVHWHLFCDRVLAPIMDRTDALSLMEICTKYGIKDEAKASNMIVTVKRRFQKLLREYLRKSVISDDLLAEELEEIKRFFPKIAQDNS